MKQKSFAIDKSKSDPTATATSFFTTENSGSGGGGAVPGAKRAEASRLATERYGVFSLDEKRDMLDKKIEMLEALQEKKALVGINDGVNQLLLDQLKATRLALGEGEYTRGQEREVEMDMDGE